VFIKGMKRLFLLIAVLAIWISPALAADKDVYIRCGCVSNGDGTSNACGVSAAYNSITNFIVGEQGTAFDPGDVMTVHVADEADANCTMSSQDHLDGFDTDVEIVFQCASGHCNTSGTTFDDTKAVIEASNTNIFPVYVNQGIPFTFQDLQFDVGTIGYTIYVVSTATDVTIQRNIFYGGGYTGGSQHGGIRINANTGTAIVRNNVFYDFTASSVEGSIRWAGSFTGYVFHNTFHNVAFAIEVDSTSPTIHFANNISQSEEQSMVDAPSGLTWGGDSGYNITDGDGTGDDDEPGSNNQVSTSVTFDNEGSDDFHLTGESATVCIANNLYAHATAPVTVDIESDARDSNTANDEYAGADTDTADSCAGGGSTIIPIIMNYYRRWFGVIYF